MRGGLNAGKSGVQPQITVTERFIRRRVDRALSVVTNPEYRAILRHLQKLWRELAKESPSVLKAQFADEISLLSQLQTEISAAAIH